MRKWSVRLALLSALLLLPFISSRAKAQSQVSAGGNFGLYGAHASTQTVLVPWKSLQPNMQPQQYLIVGNNCVTTSIGLLCAPRSISNPTNMYQYNLAFTLTPNGTVGGTSGSITIVYQNSNTTYPTNFTFHYSANPE